MSTARGHITREATMWCGKCVHWEQDAGSNLSRFKRERKARGWKLTKSHGWVCPECRKKGDA